MPGNLRILIIDDNDVSRSSLRFILSSITRYQIVGQAASAKRGLELVEQLLPDLICLDIILPDGDGLSLLKLIKIRWPQIVVLMVTGSNDNATMSNATRNGASGYIVKPFNPDTLLYTVQKAMLNI